MNLTNNTPVRCHLRAFTALEALVMLVALFILTMLGIGLWMKSNKEDAAPEQAPPANTTEIIKNPSSQSNPTTPEKKSP